MSIVKSTAAKHLSNMNIIVLWLDGRPRRFDTVSHIGVQWRVLPIIIIICFPLFFYFQHVDVYMSHTPMCMHRRLPAIPANGLGRTNWDIRLCDR